MKTITSTPDSVIEKHFALPEEIAFYSNAARNDLYNGPRESYDDDKYPWKGFVDAVRRVKAYNEKHLPSEIWVDMDCEQVLDALPEGEEIGGESVEPYLDNTYHYEYAEIKAAIYGKELASYV